MHPPLLSLSSAGTYQWKSLLAFLSDETEVTGFTGCSYDKMDVTGSGGRLLISLHNVLKPVHLLESWKFPINSLHLILSSCESFSRNHEFCLEILKRPTEMSHWGRTHKGFLSRLGTSRSESCRIHSARRPSFKMSWVLSGLKRAGWRRKSIS